MYVFFVLYKYALLLRRQSVKHFIIVAFSSFIAIYSVESRLDYVTLLYVYKISPH